MNANPVFCCRAMAVLISERTVKLKSLSNDGHIIATIGDPDQYIPVKYCPACGKEFHLTFLADSEVYR